MGIISKFSSILVHFRARFSLLIFQACTSSTLLAVVPYSRVQSFDELFPASIEVAKQKRFWLRIFQDVPSTTTLVYDLKNPLYVVDLIDFHSLMARHKWAQMPKVGRRSEISRLYLKRYQLALDRFRLLRKNAASYGLIEERIFAVYGRERITRDKIFHGQISLRTQPGLSDEFLMAAKKAKEFLPFMENVFQKFGLPRKLARLAFVESMFNINAKSKVGASGIWQIMPETGLDYLKITNLVDERNSPYKATYAAARLLAENYQILQSWPLAITAYNHGRGGILKAIKQLNTNDLSTIIRYYESPTFGYASKNFFAEFLAASETYDWLLQKENFLGKKNFERQSVLSLKLKKRLSISELMAYTPLNESILKKFNPCLKPVGFGQLKHQKLPDQFELFVPEHLYTKTLKSLARIGQKNYAQKRSNDEPR